MSTNGEAVCIVPGGVREHHALPTSDPEQLNISQPLVLPMIPRYQVPYSSFFNLTVVSVASFWQDKKALSEICLADHSERWLLSPYCYP